MPKQVAIIGAGWAGSSAARALLDAGLGVEVFESAQVIGGHSRTELLQGVVYEPNGPHIFHSENERAVRWARRFGLRRRFDFQPKTRIEIDGEERLLCWPLRRDEVATLPEWPRIARELAERPSHPDAASFESWCVSLLGETLYRLFVHGYTVKQWGCEPRLLSSSFAPKRIDFRETGRRGLFLDRWQYFPARGVNRVIEAMLQPVAVHLGARITLPDLDAPAFDRFDQIVVTAPLDDFAGPEAQGRLAWRGMRVVARFHDTADVADTHTPAYVINEPRLDVPYTRTVESKHATGQRIRGTVVCEEYPGAPARHYPVHTADAIYERENQRLKDFIRRASRRPVTFCGRLANYRYINQDQAILEGLRVVDDLLAD
ncbi:MAG: FAD-dependent oxidoreductase [Acidobacteriota bacterium]